MSFSVFVLCAIVASNVAPTLGLTQTPIEKVITMLQELRTKVSSEGDKEAETYNKFACFCKDTSEAKMTAVEEGENQKDTLQSGLNKLMSERETAGSDISLLQKQISENEDSVAVMRKERREQRLEFAGSEVDLTGAVQALEGAIRMLKATKKEVGLIELKPAAKTLRQALLLAEGLGIRQQSSGEIQRLISALAQEEPEVPTSIYEFHAEDIVASLEGLLTDFRARKIKLDEEEVAARAAHDTLVQDKMDSIKEDEQSIEDTKKAKAEATARIGTTSQDLTTTSAQLLDDQTYLAELTTKCNEKAVIWDQRTQARADELQALTQALSIIQAQQAKAEGGEEDDEEDYEDVGLLQAVPSKQKAQPTSFLQVSSQPSKHTTLSVLSHHAKRSLSLSKRNQAINFLRARASQFKSAVLSSLVARAAKDPFVKIKTMIQGLIERLLKQAASEASHKGYCDKAMGLAEQSRDQRATEIADVNGKMAIGEARRDKLKELLVVVTDELAAITDTLEEAREMRADEKSENAEAVKEAQAAVDAVKEAIDILSKFYKTTAKATASLLIKSREVLRRRAVVEEEPDAGFQGAYTGAQGGKEGVIGMLEVIQSDFERTITDIEKAEESGAQDFKEFDTTAGSSLATKEVAKRERTTALSGCEADLATDKAQMESAQEALNKALEELQALHPACVGSPESPEERKMKRDEEMASLRQALCILDSQGSGAMDC